MEGGGGGKVQDSILCSMLKTVGRRHERCDGHLMSGLKSNITPKQSQQQCKSMLFFLS